MVVSSSSDSPPTSSSEDEETTMNEPSSSPPLVAPPILIPIVPPPRMPTPTPTSTPTPTPSREATPPASSPKPIPKPQSPIAKPKTPIAKPSKPKPKPPSNPISASLSNVLEGFPRLPAHILQGMDAIRGSTIWAASSGSSSEPPKPVKSAEKPPKKPATKVPIQDIPIQKKPLKAPKKAVDTTMEDMKRREMTMPIPSNPPSNPPPITPAKVVVKFSHSSSDKKVITSSYERSDRNRARAIDAREIALKKGMEEFACSLTLENTPDISTSAPIALKVGAVTILTSNSEEMVVNGLVIEGTVKESCGIDGDAIPKPLGGMICMSIPASHGTSTNINQWGALLGLKKTLGMCPTTTKIHGSISSSSFDPMDVDDDETVLLQSDMNHNNSPLELENKRNITKESMFTFFGCENIVMEPFVHYSVENEGVGILSFNKCKGVRITNNMFSGMGNSKYGIRLVDCIDVVIEKCSFFENGVLIQGDCKNIVLNKCEMVVFKDPFYGGGQTPLITIQSNNFSNNIQINDCKFNTLVKSKYMTKINISHGFATTSTPCFIHTHGKCSFKASNCTIVGAIGTIGEHAEYAFEDCEFNRDHDMFKCLDTPLSKDQEGLERTLRVLGNTWGSFVKCIMRIGTRVCVDSGENAKTTFDGCTFFNGMRSFLGKSPIEVLGNNCIISILGNTVLGLPLGLDLYSKSDFNYGILCRTIPGCLLHMDGELLIDFYHFNNGSDQGANTSSNDNRMAMDTLVATPVFRSLRLFDEGVLNMPVVFCKGDGFKFAGTFNNSESKVPLPDVVFKSFFMLNNPGDRFVFHAKGRFFPALARGVELRGLISTKERIDLRNFKDIIVMSTMVSKSSKNLHIMGNGVSTKITIIPPIMLAMSSPICIKMEGIQVENVSSMGMKTFFTSMPTNMPCFEFPEWSYQEDATKFMSSTILACQGGMVDALNCKFKMDCGCCNKDIGVCVVEQASVTSFKNCAFETMMPNGFPNGVSPYWIQDMAAGPGVSVCHAPAYGRVAFRDCDGMENVTGGCEVVFR